MKSPAIFFLFPLVIAAGASVGVTGQQIEREPGHVTAEGIPECLHVGDRIEAMVSVDAGELRDKINLTVSSQWGKVSLNPRLADGLDEPIVVIIRGEKFGRDNITLSLPSRPDITPLTANIRVLPSYEPPQGLSTHPTEELVLVHPDGEGDPNNLFRAIIFKWRPKQGVNFYWIQMFDAEHRKVGGSRAPAHANSTRDYAPQNTNSYWRIRASIDTCTGDADWTPYSSFMPFSS